MKYAKKLKQIKSEVKSLTWVYTLNPILGPMMWFVHGQEVADMGAKLNPCTQGPMVQSY